MKIRNDFLLRKVADTYAVFPVGQATLVLNGMLTLNESGAFLWQQMNKETAREVLAEALKERFGISLTVALQDVDKFISALRKAGCLEE